MYAYDAYDESDSSCSSIRDEEDSSCDDENHVESTSNLMSKCIIHLDIDCFYCQCEEILNPLLAEKPVAIGQKHIIVTANYVARKLGIKKLMGRIDAIRVCPSLTILDGSDLEKYRKASRQVYDEFRLAVKELGQDNITKKGCMDEMFADITCAVIKHNNDDKSDAKYLPEKSFIYGESGDGNVVISEDQSGAEATIASSHHDMDHYWKQDMNGYWGSINNKRSCQKRLCIALMMASQIKERIRSKTQFSASIGVSVSPMLAKLASDLKKPDSTNLLYPWFAKSITLDMPLRRIPGLGSKTYKALLSCLQTYNRAKREDDFWTCRDLLNVPRHIIVASLSECETFHKKCEQQCDILLNRCNGIDTVPIVDDDGGLTKTVSVEDSFIRGSITTADLARQKLNLLCNRLLRLLDQRRELSQLPHLSYPRSIRVTVRLVDTKLVNSRRRPFHTVSKQRNFNGKQVLEDDDETKRESILHNIALPILDTLLSGDAGSDINVTRLNLAAISFADIDSGHKSTPNRKTKQKSVSNYFSSAEQSISKPPVSSTLSVSQSQGKHPLKRNEGGCTKRSKIERDSDSPLLLQKPSWIDPSVFASLPADIAHEVMTHQSLHLQSTLAKKKKATGIQSFFKKK